MFKTTEYYQFDIFQGCILSQVVEVLESTWFMLDDNMEDELIILNLN